MLEALRGTELQAVRAWFPPHARVLEVGGDTGYQASLLASWACNVVSVDIPERPRTTRPYFPVADYDGRHLPFADAAFDRVFTSNVLEHVPHLPQLLVEMRRVLRPDGLAIHIVPSATWRLWTGLAHYLWLAEQPWGRTRRPPVEAVAHPAPHQPSRVAHGRLTLVHRAARKLVVLPHGEYPSAVAELWHYRRTSWRRVLERSGVHIIWEGAAGLFYTGYALFPWLRLRDRQRLASLLGSACHVFVVQRASS